MKKGVEGHVVQNAFQRSLAIEVILFNAVRSTFDSNSLFVRRGSSLWVK